MERLELSDDGPIACVLLGRIGDVVTATSFLRALRRRYPGRELRLALSASCRGLRPLLAPAIADPDIAWVHPWSAGLRNVRVAAFMSRPASAVIDLNPAPSKSAAALVALSRRTKIKIGFRKRRLNGVYTHQIDEPREDEPMLDRYARLSAFLDLSYDGRTALSLGQAARQRGLALLESAGFKPGARAGVAIHPGNFKKFDNRWPEEKFVGLADRLLEDPGLALYFLAGPGERRQVEAIARACKRPAPVLPQASLEDTAAMLSRMSLLVCNVTGTTHVAHALGLPTFGLYSRYTDAVWRPRNGRCGGVVSAEWESCRSTSVEEAYRALRAQSKDLGLDRP